MRQQSVLTVRGALELEICHGTYNLAVTWIFLCWTIESSVLNLKKHLNLIDMASVFNHQL